MPPTRSLVAFFIALAATQFGCNSKSPTAPTPAPGFDRPRLGIEPLPPLGFTLQRLEIEVPASFAPDRTFLPGQEFAPALVLAPGTSVQLTAKGYLADGTSRDVTQEARWQLSPWSGVASVTGGLIQAQRHGTDTLTVELGFRDTHVWAQKQVFVMSDGTYVLRGHLRDAGSGQPISGATVSVGSNPLSTTSSRHDGSYLLSSVPPVADITASRPGYRNKVQRVTLADHTAQLDFALDEETPLARFAGTYRLTLAADPNCSVQGRAFPDELRVRTYTAVVTQFGNELTVTLSGATFHPDSGGRFGGRVSPGLATFSLTATYWYTSLFDGDVLEQPWPRTVLTIAGRATMSTSTLAGELNGSFSFQNLDEPFGSSGSSCSSPNHQFRMSH